MQQYYIKKEEKFLVELNKFKTDKIVTRDALEAIKWNAESQ